MKPSNEPKAFNLAVLEVIRKLQPNAYGVTIRQEVERLTGGFVSIASVYKSLERLEAMGLIRAELGDPTPARGNRPKKFCFVVEGK